MIAETCLPTVSRLVPHIESCDPVTTNKSQVAIHERHASFYRRLAEIHEEAAQKINNAIADFSMDGGGQKRVKNDMTLNELLMEILQDPTNKSGLRLSEALAEVKRKGFVTSSKKGDDGLYQIIYQAVRKMCDTKTVMKDPVTRRYRRIA